MIVSVLAIIPTLAARSQFEIQYRINESRTIHF
jgi:uncharacterized membrane protein